jgi:hypothetical protein
MNDIISVFPHSEAGTPTGEMHIGDFLGRIINGTWQDDILKLRTITDKEKRSVAKKKLPCVTISGKFPKRKNADVNGHSSRLAMDIDEDALAGKDINEVKELLAKDEYTYAVFNSCSGRGLCWIITINPKKHYEAFHGASEYLLTKYGLIADPKCSDIGRLRYVSYDPGLLAPERKKVFAQYPIKDKTLKTVKNVVFINSHWQQIISDIKTSGVDITPTYGHWMNVAFAMADQFGEAGREDFHRICKNNSTYTEEQCDYQYTVSLNREHTPGKKLTTMGTVYHYCKQAGINIVDERTQELSGLAYGHKLGGSTKEQSIKTLVQFSGFDEELIKDVVTQIFDKDIVVEGTKRATVVSIWLANRYNLWLNLVNNRMYDGKRLLTNKEYGRIEQEINEDLGYDYATIGRIVADVIPKKHEIKAFFEKYENRNPVGSIARLAACLKSRTGEGTDYVERFLTKWLVGGVAAIYGEEPHIMLILCGEYHGSGKSHFFKYLLPDELKDYTIFKDLSGLSSSTEKKDLEIAITKSWLVVDDEMGGKSKRDHKLIKAFLAKSYSDNRAAYDRLDEHRKRIAFFGGTSNDLEIISDHGDNRRMVPIRIEEGEIDYEAKDRIDPVDYFMEAYHLYQAGYDYRILGKDKDFLNLHTGDLRTVTIEMEMLFKHFRKPKSGNGEYITATDVKNRLEGHTKHSLWMSNIAGALKAMGIRQERKYFNGAQGRYYYLEQLSLLSSSNPELDKEDEPPF